jgi:urease accessory protein UreE
MAEKKFDPKWLEGLSFSFAEKTMIEKDGRKTLHAVPKKRPLKEEDMLDWKDNGETVVIVTKDGKKYTVKKKGGGVGSKDKD